MCGRFTLTLEEAVLRRQLELIQVPEDWLPRYNIGPSQRILVQTADDGIARWMNWGLIPFYDHTLDNNKGLINARSETVHEKATFRQSFERRRCLVPADGFYEWQRSRDRKVPSTPYRFALKNGEPFYFAGIWDSWQRDETVPAYLSCAILTTRPNELLMDVHDRMPVIFDRRSARGWLDEADTDALRAMMAPYPSDLMARYPVSHKVNSPVADDPSLIEPAETLRLF